MADSGDTAGAVDVAAAVREGEGHWTLDATKSSAEFHVKHFWGLMTVHGHFERLDGEGSVGPDGSISGRLVIDAASLTTNNGRRDKHLRSPDFFDAEQHPNMVVAVRDVTLAGPTAVRGRVVVEAAGREQELEATMVVLEAGPQAATLRCELDIDRTAFGMTWGKLGMTAAHAHAVVTARFARQ